MSETRDAVLYRRRCGWCGAYEGTVDPKEPCATDETGYIGPHQFEVLEAVRGTPQVEGEALATPAAGEDVRERIKAAIREGVRYVAKADGAYLYEPSVDETADRIIALLRTPRGEGEAAMSANLARALAAMQAAWIEWRRGRGAPAAMRWIENTLIGPGLIPGDDESDAQAFFDRAIAEIENHQIRHAVALRSEAQGEESEKDARDLGYMLGVLHAAEHVFGHGQDLIAAELVDEIMDGFGARRVKDLAKAESVEIRWSEVNAVRAARRGEGGE